jgi:hypothetical protein
MRDQDDGHFGAGKQRSVATHILPEHETRGADLLAGGHDLQHVIHPAGPEIIDLHPPHDEDRGLPLRRVGESFCLDAEQSDEVGAPALAKFQEIGVIDDAATIRVLEINADRQNVSVALDPSR